MSAVTIGLVGLTGVGLGYAGWTAVRSKRPAATPFVVMLACLGSWMLATTFPVVVGVSDEVWPMELWQNGSWLAVPLAWVVYARRYAGRSGWWTRRIVVSVGIVVASLVTTAVPVPDDSPAALVAPVVALLAVVVVISSLAYGTRVLFDVARSHDRVSYEQVAVVLGVAVTPMLVRLAASTWVVIRVFTSDVEPERAVAAIPLSEVPVGFCLVAGLAVLAVRRYPVLTGFPRVNDVARSTVVRDLREPVVVVDYDGRILDPNDSARDTFGWNDAVSNTPITDLLPTLVDYDLSAGVTQTVALHTTAGRRRFQFSVSPIGPTDADGEPVARAILFRDITTRRTREQRLSVLNRILRHNIRNDLNVVTAYAAEIDDPAIADPIRSTADELVSLGQKARRVERVMDAATDAPEAVDLADLVATIAHDVGDDDALTVETPDECVIDTNASVVRAVVTEIVENAVTHGGESPSVGVRVRETDEAVEIIVTDDGPGIPDHDRQVVEQAAETDLAHGSGLGLWLVQWGVTQLGGAVTFEHREPTGTRVTVRLFR